MRKTVLLLLSAACLATPVAASVPPSGGRAVKAGVAVDLSVEPVEPGNPGELREGQEAVFRFAISDTATGTPLAGSYPAAWIDFLPDAPTTESKGCTERVEELIAGSILSQPEVDLNVYYVLALNEDATISVVDPLFGFGGSKLLAMVYLDSPGEDWALSPDKNRLYVSLPDSNQVAVVDTAAWKVQSRIAVGPRPSRLALQPDGARLWVVLETGVAAIDTAKLSVAATLPTGSGSHDLALSDDNRFAWVTNSGEKTLSVIDAARLARLRDVPLNVSPTSLAYSPLAQAAYVSSEEAGAVVAVSGGDNPQVLARMEAEPGLGQIRFAPDGRLGFVVNPRTNQIHILDAARNRIIQTGTLQNGPDQVTFSDSLAYVRHRGSDAVLMIPLKEVGEEGTPVPAADFPGGQHPLGAWSRPSSADSIVRAPGADAVLVANPADKAIYFYREGMAAPMGSFQNYSREPRAVLVVDRSLKERKAGSYETVARLPRPGHYQVAFFLDSPRAVHCFPLTVSVDPAAEERRARLKPAKVESLVDTSHVVHPGEKVRLRFRLSDPRTGQPKDGLQDVTVLVFTAASHQEWREAARSVGEGVYEAEVTPPLAGTYHVAVASPSMNLPFHLAPRVILRVQ
ncbi:MAG TPA: YncE family protein [Thermoanaerobaculia bacterium]|nr:YncE family protein [Thermoanaerobaculia bacterium]